MRNKLDVGPARKTAGARLCIHNGAGRGSGVSASHIFRTTREIDQLAAALHEALAESRIQRRSIDVRREVRIALRGML